ncbi:MAG: ROK family glucokinase [Lachnospiraceae bacterium]|nr:ROK family glucokinase [Lachnospiraceae bacterium]
MDKKYIFGVDVGGTTVKMGFFTVAGELLDKWEIVTRKEENGQYILPDIAESILTYLTTKQISKEEIAGIGIGVPGPVNDKGVIRGAVNLGWKGEFSVVDQMETLTGMPVKASNDANVAALGEMWKGGGQGYRNLILVTLGTGIGGGVILDGKIWTGTSGSAGEIGHIHVEDSEKEICTCGNYGCLEQYGSATGIVRLAKRYFEDHDVNSVLKTADISAKAIFDAVKAEDTAAVEIAKQFGEYLGKGLASIAAVVDPEAFVIGGGVSKAGEVIFEYVRPVFERNVFHACRSTAFCLATLGNDAGIYGAAKLVL